MLGILIHIRPRDVVNDAVVDVFLGSASNPVTLGADGENWQSAIIRRPRIAQEFVDLAWTGRLLIGRADFSFKPDMLEEWPAAAGYEWEGAEVVIYRGSGRNLSDLNEEFRGIILQAPMNAQTKVITASCEIDSQRLSVPLLISEFTGGGDMDGDVENKGRPHPAAFGNPRNVPVFTFDETNNVGIVDGYGAVTSVSNLFEDLADFGTAEDDYSDPDAQTAYDDLVAATLEPGEWAFATSDTLSFIRLGAPREGVITADLVAAGNRPGAMIKRILEEHTEVDPADIRDSDFTALDVAVNRPVSHWTESGEDVLSLIQNIAASANATLILGLDGKIGVKRIVGGSVSLTINRKGGERLVTDWQSFPRTTPWWRQRMTAAQVYRVHNDGEIDFLADINPRGDFDVAEVYRLGDVARGTDGVWYLYINSTPTSGATPPNVTYWEVFEDAIDAGVVRYAGGETLESLKPGEAGADQTGSNTAAAIIAQGDLATESSVAFDTLFLKESTGGSTASLTDFKTGLGTASAIAGQGAFATQSTVGYGSSYLSGFGVLAAREDLFFGASYIRETDGGAIANLSNFKTGLGTASAIIAQGALATKSTAVWNVDVSDIPGAFNAGGLDAAYRLFTEDLHPDFKFSNCAIAGTGAHNFYVDEDALRFVPTTGETSAIVYFTRELGEYNCVYAGGNTWLVFIHIDMTGRLLNEGRWRPRVHGKVGGLSVGAWQTTDGALVIPIDLSAAGEDTYYLSIHVQRTTGTFDGSEGFRVHACDLHPKVGNTNTVPDFAPGDWQRAIKLHHARLDIQSGRLNDTRAYTTQGLLNALNRFEVSPTYTVNGSDITVNIPAATAKISSPSGVVSLSYGSSSGNVAFEAVWYAYYVDKNLEGDASPTLYLTTDKDDLLHPDHVFVSYGTAPASGGGGGSTGGGGGYGGGGGGGGGGQLP